MSEDTKFWSITSVVTGVVLVVMCITGKACNDSDNATMRKALDKGCSVIQRQLICWEKK